MSHVLAATTGLFRDRDLFIHDGSKLRRFRISAPLQAVLFVALLALVAWAGYATARLVTRPHATVMSLSAATEARECAFGEKDIILRLLCELGMGASPQKPRLRRSVKYRSGGVEKYSSDPR